MLGAVHDLQLLELVAETLRAALDDLAAVVPGLAARARSARAGSSAMHTASRTTGCPSGKDKREAFALEVGADGFALLDALDDASAPGGRASAADGGHAARCLARALRARRRTAACAGAPAAELPPVGERLQSPYDPEMHYSTKREMEWSGYKVHVTETCDDRGRAPGHPCGNPPGDASPT